MVLDITPNTKFVYSLEFSKGELSYKVKKCLRHVNSPAPQS